MPDDLYTPTLLVGHHDRPLREALAEQLTIDGYEVLVAGSESGVLQVLKAYGPLVLLLGTLERPEAAAGLLRKLRADRVPGTSAGLAVITLGETDTVSRLRAYEQGSDHHLLLDGDYVLLRAVVAAVVRRCCAGVQGPGRIERGALVIDTHRREVLVDGSQVRMPAREFELLRTLAASPSHVFTKDELLKSVWGYADHRSTRTLDTHACRLRRRLADRGHQAVRSVWGVGYSLE